MDESRLLKELYPDFSSEELAVMAEVARRRGLDPLSHHIVPVHRWNSRLQRQTMVLLMTIDGYRSLAERTGQYFGQDDIQFGEETEGHPAWARATVYKLFPQKVGRFCATAYWDEFVQMDGQGRPTGLWGKMPHNQLAKCAEALALRKAFPILSGLYIKDEFPEEGEAELENGAQLAVEVEMIEAARSETEAKPSAEAVRSETEAKPSAEAVRSEAATKPSAEPSRSEAAAKPTTELARSETAAEPSAELVGLEEPEIEAGPRIGPEDIEVSGDLMKTRETLKRMQANLGNLPEPTNTQRGWLAGLLNNGLGGDEMRHALLQLLFGKASIKDLMAEEFHALWRMSVVQSKNKISLNPSTLAVFAEILKRANVRSPDGAVG